MTTTTAHDSAGNMTRVPIPGDWQGNWLGDFDLTFDAWNKLVAVDDGSEVVAEYDGRNFRIVKTTDEEIRHYFYTRNWRCVEERATADDSDVPAPEDLDADMQYVWGLRYIDDLILRDRDTSVTFGENCERCK